MPVAKQDHQSKRPKGEVQTETGEMLKGPKPLDLPKQQQEGSQPDTKQQSSQNEGQQQQGTAAAPKQPAQSGQQGGGQGGKGSQSHNRQGMG